MCSVLEEHEIESSGQEFMETTPEVMLRCLDFSSFVSVPFLSLGEDGGLGHLA